MRHVFFNNIPEASAQSRMKLGLFLRRAKPIKKAMSWKNHPFDTTSYCGHVSPILPFHFFFFLGGEA